MFPEIGLRFDEELGIYLKDESFDAEEFREEVGLESKKKKTVAPEEVVREVEDGIPGEKLRDRLMQKFEVSRATAYRAIEKTRESKMIREDKGQGYRKIYFLEPLKETKE